MDKDYCPSSPSGKHNLGGQFATVLHKSDFEPVEIGLSARDTLYRRREYIVAICSCGYSRRTPVEITTDD